jgi:sulfur relay (sulfurtransferase) DsrF/TusC family protein
MKGKKGRRFCMGEVVIQGIIENRIFLIRGQRVMIDRDIAELYGVENKYLNRQARNNIRRFPDEFMFKLTKAEKDELVTFFHRFKTIKH